MAAGFTRFGYGPIATFSGLFVPEYVSAPKTPRCTRILAMGPRSFGRSCSRCAWTGIQYSPGHGLDGWWFCRAAPACWGSENIEGCVERGGATEKPRNDKAMSVKPSRAPLSLGPLTLCLAHRPVVLVDVVHQLEPPRLALDTLRAHAVGEEAAPHALRRPAAVAAAPVDVD